MNYDNNDIILLSSLQTISNDKVQKLFHYTSAKSKEKIIGDNEVSLLCTKVEDFLDKNEGVFILEPFYHACGELYEKNNISSDFYELLKSINEKDLKKGASQTYVACFSKNGNSVFLKRRYAPNNGWILGFLFDGLYEMSENYPATQDMVKLVEVCYSFNDIMGIMIKNIEKGFECYEDRLPNIDENKKSKFKESIKKVFVNWLREYNLVYKASDYSHEEEIRLICELKKEFRVWKDKKQHIKLQKIKINKKTTVKIILDKKYLLLETQELCEAFDSRINKSIVFAKDTQEVFDQG